ncbi:hypothetical protein M407DRAFT_8332 [Tulasnella calospora MUT 4182]|uniref:Uncharacterized protein n=1 Tax=Tulasnella calospora MUT 4182 TaxID=1051891 RepID=A0A0C3LW33_9AGAM|nr:hypothetical protein M407DRAFT_8332 [Tulasnella calospora MUT 4182]
MQEVRKAYLADFRPILVIVLIPKDDLKDEDPQVSNIEEMCKVHYSANEEEACLKYSPLFPALIGCLQYLFVRIATAPKMDDTHTSKIIHFLRARSNVRVLIILSMHSSGDDGKVEWVNSTKKRPSQRGLISEVSYLILCVVKSDLNQFFKGLNHCIGIPVLDAIRDLTGDKGLMLLCCGGTLAREGSRVDIVSKLLGIATAPKMDDTHTSKIIHFLRARSNVRVLIILSMHSSGDDGKVEWVNSTKKRPSQRGLISEVSYLILCVVKSDLNQFFKGLNHCIGIPVLDAIRDLTGDKGLMLLCCGGSLACEGSRADIVSKLLGPNTLRFVLGFSTASLFPESVAHQCQSFFYYCFLWISPGTCLEVGTDPTRAYSARLAAFAWGHASNSAAGVVLIKKLSNDQISSTEFRMGVPSTRPWGLFIPDCPFCRVSYRVQAQHANNQHLELECARGCGVSARSVINQAG